MSDPSIRGRFVWHELMTSDPKSAAAFYSRLTGWTTAAWPGDASYTICSADDRPVAGIMALPDDAKKMGAPPNWVTHIAAPNVDDAAKLAVSLGARVLKAPTDVPGAGRFAVIQDPQGAVFCLYTPQTASPETPPGVGDFSWHELATTDWRAALAFYQRLFGWDEAGSMDMGPNGTYQMFGRSGRPLGGIFNKLEHMTGPASWLPYIHVGDAKGVAAAVKALGGHVINGPMEVPGGDWIAQGLDLQGAVFAVHSAKAVTPKAAEAGQGARKAPARKKAPAKKSVAKKASKSRASRKATLATKVRRPVKKSQVKAKKRVLGKPVATRGAAKRSGGRTGSTKVRASARGGVRKAAARRKRR